MTDSLENELSVAVAPVPVAAPVTSIAVDPIAREVAVQVAMADVKADAAVAQLNAQAAKAVVPVPVAAPAPVASPCGDEEVVSKPEPELDPMQRLETCEKHIVELVRHLAQSFGGEFATKKDRMGV